MTDIDAWRQVQREIATCRDCVRLRPGIADGTLQPDEIPDPPETVDILFVGVAPTDREGSNKGGHFYSSSRDALRRGLFRLLSKPGLDLGLVGLDLPAGNSRFHQAGCFFVHAAKVRPVRRLAPPRAVIGVCAQRHLRAEIPILAPRVVCFLGRKTEPAARSLFGRSLAGIPERVELGDWKGHALLMPQPVRRGVSAARRILVDIWRTTTALKQPGSVEAHLSPARPFFLVGLTGGIASGKSAVSRQLSELGCRLVDADVLAREVVEPGTPALRAIVDTFGPDVVDAEGRLDRKRLGALVFADPARRKTLEVIIHPAITARRQAILDAWAGEGFDGIVVLDIPLLVEVGAVATVDRVVLVYAEPAAQLERLRRRDGFDAAEAARRVRSQMPLGEKVRHAHYVVDNSGSSDETAAQVRGVHAALVAEHRARRRVAGSPP